MVKHFSKRKKVHLFYSISWKHVSGRQILRKLKLFFSLWIKIKKSWDSLWQKPLLFLRVWEDIFRIIHLLFFIKKVVFFRKLFSLFWSIRIFRSRKIRYFFERVKPFQKKKSSWNLETIRFIKTRIFFSNSTQFSFWKKYKRNPKKVSFMFLK